MKSDITAHIFYSGRVQGVGFRFTTQHIARENDLVGWVKNLADGRVEILCRGSKEEIMSLCRGLEHKFENHRLSKEIQWLDKKETLIVQSNHFYIRH